MNLLVSCARERFNQKKVDVLTSMCNLTPDGPAGLVEFLVHLIESRVFHPMY